MGKPRWFQLVGLIHDLGNYYIFDSRGQWDVVGDTFPVGCKFLKRIIFPDSFKNNPDFLNPLYNTKYGIYSKHCGLDKVMLSWGHDEYMYHVAKRIRLYHRSIGNDKVSFILPLASRIGI